MHTQKKQSARSRPIPIPAHLLRTSQSALPAADTDDDPTTRAAALAADDDGQGGSRFAGGSDEIVDAVATSPPSPSNAVAQS